MSDVTITVRGSAECSATPELATVRLAAETEGGDRERVYTAVRDNAATLSAQLSQLKEAGAVREWSSDQLSAWSYRPWQQNGERGPLMHHARVEVRATFPDFTALSSWTSRILALEGVAVSGIEWTLTETHQGELVERARAEAVADAVAKAGSYAGNLGLGTVRPVAIADAGMLGGAERAEPPMAFAAHSRAMAAESADIALVPQQVRVAAAVDARFAAC